MTQSPDRTSRTEAILIGPSDWHEFREVRASLVAHTQLRLADNLDDAIEQLRAGATSPDLIVVAQIFPNHADRTRVHAIRRLAPLARVVTVLGSWCEGETRTGHPWPGVARMYWHQWPIGGESELLDLANARDVWWQLPNTASRDERFLIKRRDTEVSENGLIVLATSQRESFESLADACQSVGYDCIWYRASRPASVQGAAAIVWDASGLEQADQHELRRLHHAFADVPLIALLNYPRSETVEAAKLCGASLVLSKPLCVDDLLSAIQSVAHSSAAS
ncbi:MAG: hypothetical protein MI757_12975 [Pirellulales bacterium]|nr:hypothetical protein [Pirellulales bacterium]